MNKIWSTRGSLFGGIFGLVVGLFVWLTLETFRLGETPMQSSPLYPTPRIEQPRAVAAPPSPPDFGVDQFFAVIARAHLRLGDIDAAAATLDLINDGSTRLQALLELVGPSGTGSPVAPEYVMPSPLSLNSRFDPAPPTESPQSALPLFQTDQARTNFMVQVLDTLAADIRLRLEGTGSDSASEDTAIGDQASVLAHIATMYVDAGNTERAQATLVEATRAILQWQHVLLASAPQQGTHSTTDPEVPSPLLDSMIAKDLSTRQHSPAQRPGVLVVLWTAACTVVGFVGLGLVKPIIEAFGKGIVGRAVAEYFRNESFASALGVKLTPSTEKPNAKETKQVENPV